MCKFAWGSRLLGKVERYFEELHISENRATPDTTLELRRQGIEHLPALLSMINESIIVVTVQSV